MTSRIVRADLAFDAIRDELGIEEPFPAAALEEAERSAVAPAGPAAGAERHDALDLPLVTIDPPGSSDLDQAVHLARRPGGGLRVSYAIADLAAFVAPGGALDAAVRDRGVTYYAPDRAVALHPDVLSAGAASLLPGQERPAVLWTIDLDPDGAPVAVDVRRARVRSRAQLTYAGVQDRLDAGTAEEPLAALAEFGALRAAAEAGRGGVSLRLPAQEVVPAAGGGWALAYRAPLAVEAHNAQVSLLTGMAAADLQLAAGTGILRTLPPADPGALAALRREARALAVPWPGDLPYPAFVRDLDPAVPAHAALLQDATAVMRGAGYAAFDGAPPEDARHHAIAEEYAHVTAPLRRLADRWALECALAACAGTEVPAWAREGLDGLPDAMAAAGRRASSLERAAVDAVEALVLRDRIGQVFDAVAVDDGLVLLADPAVRARCDGDPPVGKRVRVRLTEADVEARKVRFALDGTG